jgi:CBS domain-containing protein
MTANPACCTPDTTLREVAQMMEQNDCGLIPVVESHSGMRPIGTITDRDITIRAVAASQNPINMKASDIMTSDVATVMPEMSLEECFNVMEDREIRRVLVVDSQGKCCGIVAQADVVQSDANPNRTNKVIREISESAPSHNQRFAGMSGWNSRSNYVPAMSTSSVLPLLIGLGSGVALMYMLNNRRDRDRVYIGDSGNYSMDRMDATNSENFGKYVDAEQEVQKRQHHLEDRVQSLRADLDSPASDRADEQERTSDTAINNKGRSAGQNG